MEILQLGGLETRVPGVETSFFLLSRFLPRWHLRRPFASLINLMPTWTQDLVMLQSNPSTLQRDGGGRGKGNGQGKGRMRGRRGEIKELHK